MAIRVFQNAHISRLRATGNVHALPDDDVALPLPVRSDGRWHEAFCQAARETLSTLSDAGPLILGLRLRYRMSQREAAHLLGIHEVPFLAKPISCAIIASTRFATGC